MADGSRLSSVQAIRAFAGELNALIDTDPGEALRRARAAVADPALERTLLGVQASIFIDAGTKARAIDVMERVKHSRVLAF